MFFEAAGAETVHAYSHLVTLDAIGTTLENLRAATRRETSEIEQMYPRMIAEAEADSTPRAAASFRLALERERYHQQMFRRALATWQDRGMPADVVPVFSAPRDQQGNEKHTTLQGSGNPASTGARVDRTTAKRGLPEMESERERIARLANIREVIFGGQDGLISITTLVAGIATTTLQTVVVLVAGTLAAIAGALSMAVGAYLALRAQRQFYEAEMANEAREVAEKPGEEMAELLAALIGHGMPRRDAIEVVRRVAGYPKLLTELLSTFELGLPPHSLSSPVRDALVIGIAFLAGAVIPLFPFLVLEVHPGLMVTILLAPLALFTLGAMKARLSGGRLLVSGLEVMLAGGAVGVFGYLLGRLVSAVFGISI